jgi:hypothetical protein
MKTDVRIQDMGTIANIGPREILKRRIMGIVTLTLGLGLAFLMVLAGSSRWYRLVIFIPMWLAGLGLFQAKEKT